ncbi:hypothetical protein [Rodentibacter pneumotropicus]|uniref:hypothetical protein n=2 Tax=Rodentibacter pneumotropicus TaxID=758 RepID=UPI0003632DC4|nr:hypothetical protein [Rodentibacter pneumotropicus]NBH74948.1 hypothetical protein [Rodentibacter pneumotropicus]THA06636.1 hypothetical protein D3M73_04175 [Rodentibacter pneumotropicus]THA13675.1 hypothetical protein D3M82_09335 [Rodentibacter pneumotropicus]
MMKTLSRYLVTFSCWFIIIVIIENTKNNSVLSIDNLITSMTLFSLMLQNLKVKEIESLQDWLVNKINMHEFFILTSHIFCIICLVTAIIMPIGLNEFPSYLIKFDKLSSWHELLKLIIKLSLFFAISFYALSPFGKEIDSSVGNDTNKKYGLFYAILLIIYIATKIS